MDITELLALADQRRSYVTASRDNRFEEGLRSLLSELYPDNAHFIYELLQNAEDAGATEVDFDLGKSRLIFTHNGSRLFTLADIESITGIGQSTKATDVTKIGKFGVGFKSVFAYTAAPEVRSGGYAFVIRDMFVPEPLESRGASEKTTFVFPFNRREKPRSQAYAEVERSLSELSDTSLLFLSRISSIRFRTASGGNTRISRRSIDERYVTITIASGAEKSESHWLVLRAGSELSPALPERQWVAAAFALAGPPNRRVRARGSQRARVVPLPTGQTCIYFPAAKERSGLKFHIHAPFASTVARDSVRDAPGNEALLDAIGDLIARELPGLVDDGLMDDGLLGALPNSGDELSDDYERIRRPIVEAFNTLPITPVRGGKLFAPAKSLVVTPPELRAGLELEDLETLAPLGSTTVPRNADWIAPREGRARQFMADLEAVPFGWQELQSALIHVALGDEPAERWTAFLRKKSDKQLRLLQIALGRGFLEGHLTPGELTDVPVVRVIKNGRRQIVVGSSGFLSVGDDQVPPDGAVPFELTPSALEPSSPQRYALERFLSEAGVGEWNEVEELRARLARYDGRVLSRRQHLSDIREYVALVRSRPDFAGLFSDARVLMARKPNGAAVFAAPSETYLDKPILDTGLSALYAKGAARMPVDSAYSRAVDGFLDFAMAIGVRTGFEVMSVSLIHNPKVERSWHLSGRITAHSELRDWDIPETDAVVASSSKSLKRTLWEYLCTLPDHYAEAVFRLNGSAPERIVTTRLAQRVLNEKWIPARTGSLKQLTAMTEDNLLPGWSAPKPGTLLVRLGFGELARARSEAERDQRRALSDFGLDAGSIQFLLDLPKSERNEIFQSIAAKRRQREAFPGNASVNAERRSAIVAEDAMEAPVFESVGRKRMIVAGGDEVKGAARDFLRRQYSRPDGEMHCQVCHLEMPFKVDGRPYFEAIQFRTKLTRQHRENALALCPLCSALYRFARETDDDNLREQLAAQPIDSETTIVEISVTLNGEPRQIRFTGVHAIDLRSVLAKAGARRARQRT